MSNNNDKNAKKEPKVVSDAPRFHSMAMMTRSEPTLRMPVQQPLQKSAEPRLGGSPQLKTAQPSSKAPQMEVPKPWTVPEPMALPTRYPLERSHLYVAEATPQQVGQRISDVLRDESIATTFSATEAKIDAETLDNVQFTVRLWTADDQVVVEVQRKSGCCFSFCQAARAVLRGSKGDVAAKHERSFSLPSQVLPETQEAIEAGLSEGMEVAESLLQKNRLDAHTLAMESLVQLSQASHSKLFCAQHILKGDLLATMVSLIESYRLSGTDSEQKLSDNEEEHFAIMHRHALTILANCLVALQEAGELDAVLEQRRGELVSASLVESLVRQVQRADEQPHDACQAIRCLKVLVQNSDQAKAVAMELDAPHALSQAHAQGVVHHKCLQEASEGLQAQL